MSENTFLRTPVKVTVWDPTIAKSDDNGGIVATYIPIGNIPSDVKKAVTSSKPQASVLSKYYGKNYKQKLSISPDINPTNLTEMRTIYGGIDDDDIADDVNFDDLDELLAQGQSQTPDTFDITGQATGIMPPATTHTSTKPNYVTNIDVYPDDNFIEFREKIFLMTGIPPYRQHIMWMDRGRMRTTYRVYVGATFTSLTTGQAAVTGGVYSVDISELPDKLSDRSHDRIANIPIDKTLYDARDSMRIEGLDSFMILRDNVGTKDYSPTFYVVDLAMFLHSVHTSILGIINDVYQREMFYYGFIAKYYPIMTQNVFYEYIHNELTFRQVYPDLAPSHEALTHKYREARKIINESYSAVVDDKDLRSSLTQVTGIVSNNTLINIRNLFNNLQGLEVSMMRVEAITAYVEYEMKVHELRRVFNGYKFDDIPWPGGGFSTSGLTIAISVSPTSSAETGDSNTRPVPSASSEEFAGTGVLSSATKRYITTITMAQTKYIFVNFLPSGQYRIHAGWPPEDNVTFIQALDHIKQVVSPVILFINKFGKRVLQGDSLLLPTRGVITYQSLNMSVFWSKVTSSRGWKVLKDHWSSYAKAGIITLKPVSSLTMLEQVFHRGVHEHDYLNIERIISASTNLPLQNYYEHLSSAPVKLKWSQQFSGRTMRMTQRHTDIRFDIVNLRESEYDIIMRYLKGYIVSVSKNNAITLSSAKIDTGNRLRRLNELDPELYLVKKHGATALYSIKCQGKKQPMLYTDEEIKGMTKAQLKKLTKYHNFTLNKPAWYGCPNKEYPHMSFQYKYHPKHYCLPCCHKSPIRKGSKREEVYNSCMKNFTYVDDEDVVDDGDVDGDRTKARTNIGLKHVMQYGKQVGINRMMYLPDKVNQLFTLFESRSKTKSKSGDNKRYQIRTISQYVSSVYAPIVNHISTIYNISPQGVVRGLIDAFRDGSHMLFYTLLGGKLIEYFASKEELIDILTDVFLRNRPLPNNVNEQVVNEILTEMAHSLTQISIIEIVDKGNGVFEIVIPGYLKSELIHIREMSRSTSSDTVAEYVKKYRFVLMMRMGIDQDSGSETGVKHGTLHPIYRMRIVGVSPKTTQFRYDDDIIQGIIGMGLGKTSQVSTTITSTSGYGLAPDMLSVSDFVNSKGSGFVMTKYFINNSNMCYAVEVQEEKGRAKKKCYVAINYSTYLAQAHIKLVFDNVDRDEYDAMTLAKFVSGYNKYVETVLRKQRSRPRYSVIDIRHVVMLDDMIIGMAMDNNHRGGYNDGARRETISGPITDTRDMLVSYHTATPLQTVLKLLKSKNVNVVKVSHDYSDVNNKILARSKPSIDKRHTHLSRAIWSKHIYQLLLLEFMNAMDNERNKPLRDKIKTLIRKTNFLDGMVKFNTQLTTLITDDVVAHTTGVDKVSVTVSSLLLKQLADFFNDHFDKDILIETLDSSVYDFDKLTFNRLRTLDKDTLITELHDIVARLTVIKDVDLSIDSDVDAVQDKEFPNVYMPCDEDPDSIYCESRRLVIPSKDLRDKMVSILADDIMNEIKSKYIIDSIFTENHIDYMRFTPDPYSSISIIVHIRPDS